MSATFDETLARHPLGNTWAEFDARARQLGHDPARLAAGEVITSDVLLPSLQGGSYLTVASPEQLRLRAQSYFNPVIRARRRLGQGIHDRCESVAYGGCTEISQFDLDNLAIHLPFNVRATSLREKTVRAGETWDLTIDGPERYDVDYRDDVIAVVNIGTLRLEPGASVRVQGNLFFLLCQHLVIEQDIPLGEDAFHIGVLPTPFSVDPNIGPMDGVAGRDGRAGEPGIPGRMLHLHPSLLGPQLMTPPEPGQLDGTDGTDGRPGTAGTDARTGGAAKLAEVTIRRLTGTLVVRGEGGHGGDGGHGGNGGDGGDGGDGMPGARTRQGPIRGGTGGKGGDGGRGGDGGAAGHGGIASNIYVNVPEDQEHQVRLVAVPGQGGTGGSAGTSGTGGRGGAAGPGDMAKVQGQPGADGRPGEPAQNGRKGRARAAPPMYLNERPATFEMNKRDAAKTSGAST